MNPRSALLPLALAASVALSACGSDPTAPTSSAEPSKKLGITLPAEGASPAIDAIRSRGSLRAGVIVSPPFVVQNPASSEWSGPATAPVKALAQELDVKVEWIVSDFDTIVAGLQADKFDIAATGLYATPERKRVVDFVNYAKSGACYIARKDDTRINALADLNNADLKIVVVSGSSFVTEFPEQYPKTKLTSKTPPPGAASFYAEVKTKRFDVAPIESTLAKQVAKQQPDLKVIPDPAACVIDPDLPQDVGYAVNKGDEPFKSALQSTVSALQADTDEQIQRFSDPEYTAAK